MKSSQAYRRQFSYLLSEPQVTLYLGGVRKGVKYTMQEVKRNIPINKNNYEAD